MAGQYSLKTFLRQVRGAMLNRCLRRLNIPLELNIEVVKPSIIDDLYQQLQALSPANLHRIERDFLAISELANSRGTEAILREAGRQKLDFTDIFLRARNGFERACWTFLEHAAIFDLATCFCEMDRFGSGRWNRRFVGAGITPETEASVLQRLSHLMRRSYAKEGRGQFCHIDHYLRHEPERHCFFAYPQNHATSDLAYTEHGELDQQSRKAAFEVILVYRPGDGMLEILAPGGRERVDDIASCFCTAILDLPELPSRLTPRLYELSPLLSVELALTTDPADGIERVELREICLNLGRSHGWKRRLTFSADDKAQQRESIHDMIQRTVLDDGIELPQVTVSSAKFRLIFAPVDNQRPKRLTFNVAIPDHCSLRDNYHDQVARKCLRRWGLTGDAAAATVTAARGSRY